MPITETSWRYVWVQAAFSAAKSEGCHLPHWRREEQAKVYLAALDALPRRFSATVTDLPVWAYKRVYAAALDAVQAMLLEREARWHRRANR